MGLKLRLKPRERLVINGCIIRNGDRRLEIEIENRADVLRGNEMLNEENSRTPVRRLIYLIQVVLVSKEHRVSLVPRIMDAINGLESALHKSHGDTLRLVRDLVATGDYYAACRRLVPVMKHEDVLLAIPVTGEMKEAS